MLALVGALAACSSDDGGSDVTGETIDRVADEAREAAGDGLASLRADAERLVDEIQSRNASEAKQQLLDRCRSALERLRAASSEEAERVADICDRVQNSDLDNRSAWAEIRQEIEKVP